MGGQKLEATIVVVGVTTSGDAGVRGILLTDLEGSTQHLKTLGDAYPAQLSRHLELLRSAVNDFGGIEVGSEGDSISAVFASPSSALNAAISAQRSLANETWPDRPWRVRMAVHAGVITIGPGGAVGVSLHEAARIRDAGHGGQILITDDARALVADVTDVEFVDLGVHEFRDVDVPVRIWQVATADLTREFPPLRATVTRVVPRAPTSFLGRVNEIAEIRSALDGNRLLTLVGPGGSGKTRLAMEVASRSDTFDAVFAVELASVASDDLVIPSVCSSLDVTDSPDIDTIASTIRDRRVLLVLDNCEHVIEASAELAGALLRRCSALRILATSRSALRIAGEHMWQTPRLESSDASALFAARAAAIVGPETAASMDTASVEAICERLEGSPLAVELAAARLRSLSLKELDARLNDQLGVLTGGVRDAPRHETLRATIDWSHRLLTEDEQRLLRRLSVFVGGFSLEPVEAVAEGRGRRTIESLDGLVLKSLVEFDGSTDRYRILEPIRQFAQERLDDWGEASSVRNRHAEWVARLVTQGGREYFSDEIGWTARIRREEGNIGAALGWVFESEQSDLALRIVGGLGLFWFFLQRKDHGVWVPRAMEHLTRVSDRIRARTLLAAGTAYTGGWPTGGGPRRLGEAIAWLREATASYRAQENAPGLASALFWQARALALSGDLAGAKPIFQEADAVYTRLTNVAGMGWCRSWLGVYAREEGNLAAAEAIQLDVLSLGQRYGVQSIVGGAYGELALVAIERGQEDVAQDHLSAAIETFRTLGNDMLMSGYLFRRAAWTSRMDAVAAARDVVEGLSIGASLEGAVGTAAFLTAADLLLTAGRLHQALVVAAFARKTDPDAEIPPVYSRVRWVELEEALGTSDGEVAKADARRLGLGEVVASAMVWLTEAYALEPDRAT